MILKKPNRQDVVVDVLSWTTCLQVEPKQADRVVLGLFFWTFSFTVFFCSSSSRSEVSSRKRAVESKYICIQLISIGALPVQPQVLTDYRLPKKNKTNKKRQKAAQA